MRWHSCSFAWGIIVSCGWEHGGGERKREGGAKKRIARNKKCHDNAMLPSTAHCDPRGDKGHCVLRCIITQVTASDNSIASTGAVVCGHDEAW